jgi:N-acetyl-anhydromuramyl-L-alanine amidase AmpD
MPTAKRLFVLFRDLLLGTPPSRAPKKMAPIWKGCAATNFRIGRVALSIDPHAEPERFTPEAIVIHVMAGTERGTDAWFGDASSHVSAHYGVSKTGEVHQYVMEQDVAFHAGVVNAPSWPLLKQGLSPNLYTIGIEHEGMAEDEWTDEQYSSSAELIAAIAARWSIAIDDSHVVAHRTINALHGGCPGKCDLPRLISQAQASAANA